MHPLFEKYILKQDLSRSLEFSGAAPAKGGFEAAIVIPACRENGFLRETLSSLSDNDHSALARTLVVVVVNNPPPESCAPKLVEENLMLLEYLRNSQLNGLCIAVVDAVARGREIPADEGVGGARKAGMDAALEYLGPGDDALLICLDADTTVSKGFLKAVFEFYAANPDAVGAVAEFAHRGGADPRRRRAIALYELIMRYYVAGLSAAGSPYAYHSLGSAMNCRAGAYVKAGGMRRRNGGEDFYFMQALRKIGSIGRCSQARVYPSARPSDRVPFGTGPKVAEFEKNQDKAVTYNPEIFLLLKKFLSSLSLDALKKQRPCQGSPEKPVSAFLEKHGFPRTWEKILRNSRDSDQALRRSFHTWFDAFRTLKFIHFCEREYPGRYPRIPVLDAWKIFIQLEKIDPVFNENPEIFIHTVREWEKTVFLSDPDKYALMA